MALRKLITRTLTVAVCIGAFLVSLTVETAHAQPATQRLKVAPNDRYLIKEDGSAFFYLGDTAWELFQRARREEADAYLKDRAARGFTVVHAVVLSEFDGLNVPNAYGHRPLENNDPTKPVEDYFRHIDYIVDKAQSLGLHIGMLPSWGDKWHKIEGQGIGPEIFTPANAEVFGEFLGKRYKDRPIVWILGGDRNPYTETHRAIIRAMARGIKKGDGGRHLMTFHPAHWSTSATWFHADKWLDFNMFQSGHEARDRPNHQLVTKGRQLTPAKPIMDAEPPYEDHPIDWNAEKGWFDEFDVRQAAYWSMLAGAFGHTYGNHNLWQLLQPGREPISAARTPWRTALSQPGGTQMGYLRRLFESRPFTTLVPDQDLVVNAQGGADDQVRAARGEDGSFALVYTPRGRKVAVAMNKIKGPNVKAYWFNPREGVSTEIGVFGASGAQEFAPPSQGRGNDWVLVLDDAARAFAPPGSGEFRPAPPAPQVRARP